MTRFPSLQRRAPQERSAPTAKGKQPARRSSRRRLAEAERELAARWWLLVTGRGVCDVCGTPRVTHDASGRIVRFVRLEGHHVIPKRALYRIEKERGLPAGTLVWAPETGMAACAGPGSNRCHERQEAAFKRIPRERLPRAAIRLAAALHLEGLMDRLYPVVTPGSDDDGRPDDAPAGRPATCPPRAR